MTKTPVLTSIKISHGEDTPTIEQIHEETKYEVPTTLQPPLSIMLTCSLYPSSINTKFSRNCKRRDEFSVAYV